MTCGAAREGPGDLSVRQVLFVDPHAKRRDLPRVRVRVRGDGRERPPRSDSRVGRAAFVNRDYTAERCTSTSSVPAAG